MSGWVRRGSRVLGPLSGACLLAVLALACSERPASSEGPIAAERGAATVVGAAELSEEFDLDNPVLIPAGVYCPSVAFGTSTYLVTHWEARTLMGEDVIGATRFDRSGQALDPVGKTLIEGSGSLCAPVVFTGTTFLVLWGSGDLYCMRLSEDGNVLEPGLVSTGQKQGSDGLYQGANVEHLAFDGTNVLALLSNASVALVDTSCQGIGSTTLLDLTPNATSTSRSLAFDGTRYWVGYGEMLVGAPDRYYVQAVSTAGVPSGAPVLVAQTSWLRDQGTQRSAGVVGGVAGGNGKVAIAYRLATSPTDETLNENYYAALAPDGALVNKVSTLPEIGTNRPWLGFAGDGFLLVAGNTLSKHADDGAIVSGSLAGLDLWSEPSFANDGANVLVARGEVQLLDADLAPVSEIQPTVEHAGSHSDLSLALSSSKALVAWRESNKLYGSRVALDDGAVLDAERFVIHEYGAWLVYEDPPAVGSNGSGFLASWPHVEYGASTSEYSNNIYARLVNADGTLRGPEFLVFDGGNTIPMNQVSLRIVSDGTDYLVTWVDMASTPDLTQISFYAARISASGSVLDDPPLVVRRSMIDRDNGYTPGLEAAYDGSAYVIVSSLDHTDSTLPSVEARRVSSAGAVAKPVPLEWPGTISGLAWGANQGLALVQLGSTLLAGRLDAALGSSDLLTVTSTLSSNPTYLGTSAAWDGGAYWVSWKTELGDDFSVKRISTKGNSPDPFAMVLSQTASDVHDSLTSSDAGYARASLASANGRVLAAYTRFDPARAARNLRMHGRWLKSELSEGGAAGEPGAGGTLTGTGGGVSGGSEGGAPAAAGTTSGAGEASAAGGSRSGNTHRGGTSGVTVGGGGTSGDGATDSGNGFGGESEPGRPSHGGVASSNGGESHGGEPTASSGHGGADRAGESSGGRGLARAGSAGHSDESTSGCGCRVGGSSERDARGFLAVAVALGCARLRRRRA